MFKFDREKVILFIAKAVSYLINTLIILAFLGAIGWWVHELYLSTLMTNYKH